MHCIFILDKSRVSNVTDYLLDSSSIVQSQVVAAVIKHKLNENLDSDSTASNSSLKLSHNQINGQPLHVAVGKYNSGQLSKKLKLWTDDMLAIKSDCNLSNRTLIKIASSLKAATKDRKINKSGLKSKLTFASHSVDVFYLQSVHFCKC